MAFKVPWKYCECGCKSFVTTVAGLDFSYFDDLKGGYWFSERHHPALNGRKATRDEVDRLVKEALKKRRDEVKKWAEDLEAL